MHPNKRHFSRETPVRTVFVSTFTNGVLHPNASGVVVPGSPFGRHLVLSALMVGWTARRVTPIAA